MAERDQVPRLPYDDDLLSLSEEVRRIVEENRRFLQRLFDESFEGGDPDGESMLPGEDEPGDRDLQEDR